MLDVAFERFKEKKMVLREPLVELCDVVSVLASYIFSVIMRRQQKTLEGNDFAFFTQYKTSGSFFQFEINLYGIES